LASLVTLAEGTIFAGDFRVVRPLSEGGMGAVYVVEQISTGKQRALKVMHPNLVHDPKQRQRFVQEAKIGARIESDHVVEVLGAGVEQPSGTPWLAMELLHGETLDQRLTRTGTLTRAELVEVFKQLGHALASAHDVGIVHRDLKPENIFLAVPRREGMVFVVKILDFGIAKLVAESGNTTQAIGSPLWMAPEQTNANAQITPATDVWALGLIAFTCLTGHSYWRGAHAETPNPMTLVMEVCFDALDPASQRAAEYGVAHLLPPGFDEWFAQCVCRDTEGRFKTAKPARGALERLLTGSEAITTQPLSAPVTSSAAPMEAPDLDIKPVRERERPAPAPEAKKPEPAPPVSKPRASQSGGFPASRAQPERIVIPPIKPTTPRVSREPMAAPLVESAPIPWMKIAIGVGALVVALFVAQRFFWTQPKPPAPPPAVAPVDEKGAPTKSSAPASAEKCPAGMARVPGSELVPNDPTKSIEPFCMDMQEVSVKAYVACVKSGKCTAAAAAGNWTATTNEERVQRNQSCNAAKPDRQDHPINCVDWSQADAFCKAADKRLPTEDEWRWAAKSGAAAFRYPWGFEVPDVQLCWSSFTKRTSTCAVGSFPKGADAFGVHDLAGNVREWTATTVGADRVHCGSDWTDKDANGLFKLGYCGQAPKTAKSGFVGFRCAR
jgi:serine/threonine protein kinase/formylglycine-generating enzyme required for sulfatase activity